ncbi:MAG: 30S ribosomal protein S12 methylthiotransferase RimO, partial [Firmicutes bacterium]|nr:30S ribosomal protein S12 methylthiotransferase RimO [Bacillota bacterium]
MKVYIKTLGCDKNTWDSEHAAGLLQAAGCSFTDDPSQADVMMVNTCGFIRDAKTQSIDTIFDLINIKTDKQKLI